MIPQCRRQHLLKKLQSLSQTSHQLLVLSPVPQPKNCFKAADTSSHSIGEAHIQTALSYKSYLPFRINPNLQVSLTKQFPPSNSNNEILAPILAVLLLARSIAAVAEGFGRDVVELVDAARKKKEKSQLKSSKFLKRRKKGAIDVRTTSSEPTAPDCSRL
jgi:hypothetical protein